MRLLMILVLDILLASLIGILLYYLVTDQRINVKNSNRMELCLRCDLLRLHPDDGLRSAKPTDSNSEVCCWDQNTNIQDFLVEFSDHWLKQQFREGKKYCKANSGHRKHSVKVVGTKQPENGKIKHLVWEKNSASAVLAGNGSIVYHPHGQIEVQTTGLYYVYSQVLFRHDNEMDTSGSNHLLPMHMMSVRSEGSTNADGRVHMKRVNTNCVSSQRFTNSTSYLGSMMLLLKGDRVAVQVHNKKELMPIPHMNFFGVHAA